MRIKRLTDIEIPKDISIWKTITNICSVEGKHQIRVELWETRQIEFTKINKTELKIIVTMKNNGKAKLSNLTVKFSKMPIFHGS